MALLPLMTGSKILVSGPSGAGKSEFVYAVINHSLDLFNTPIEEIYFFYSIQQQRFSTYGDKVTFIEGLPSLEFIQSLSESSHKLVIIDDQQIEACNSTIIADLFTKYSHHRNISVVLVLQNLFHQGKHSRDISLNTNYFVLFKNPRDIHQIKVLSNQLGLGKGLEAVYKEATTLPYSYLLIDLTPSVEYNHMLRSDIFPNQHTTLYVV